MRRESEKRIGWRLDKYAGHDIMNLVSNLGSGGPTCKGKSRFHMVLGPIPMMRVGAARSQEPGESGFLF